MSKYTPSKEAKERVAMKKATHDVKDHCVDPFCSFCHPASQQPLQEEHTIACRLHGWHDKDCQKPQQEGWEEELKLYLTSAGDRRRTIHFIRQHFIEKKEIKDEWIKKLRKIIGYAINKSFKAGALHARGLWRKGGSEEETFNKTYNDILKLLEEI